MLGEPKAGDIVTSAVADVGAVGAGEELGRLESVGFDAVCVADNIALAEEEALARRAVREALVGEVVRLVTGASVELASLETDEEELADAEALGDALSLSESVAARLPSGVREDATVTLADPDVDEVALKDARADAVDVEAILSLGLLVKDGEDDRAAGRLKLALPLRDSERGAVTVGDPEAPVVVERDGRSVLVCVASWLSLVLGDAPKLIEAVGVGVIEGVGVRVDVPVRELVEVPVGVCVGV